MYYKHDISPYFIQIKSLGIDIYWYGVSYFIGFLACYYFVKKNTNAKNIDVDLLLTYCIIGVIFGGRIGEVLFLNLNIYENPLKIFYIWEPGRSFHGALIGVCIAIWYFCKRHKYDFFFITDLIVPAVPIAIFLGRVGNFVNQELVGIVSTMPFSIIFTRIDSLPRHPTQIYEALTEGLLLFLILWIIRKKNLKKGYLSIIFLTLYSIFRFVIEFYKEPYDNVGPILTYFNMGHVYCLLAILIAFYLYLILKKPKRQNEKLS